MVLVLVLVVSWWFWGRQGDSPQQAELGGTENADNAGVAHEVEDVFLVGDAYPLTRDAVIPVESARRDAGIKLIK